MHFYITISGTICNYMRKYTIISEDNIILFYDYVRCNILLYLEIQLYQKIQLYIREHLRVPMIPVHEADCDKDDNNGTKDTKN